MADQFVAEIRLLPFNFAPRGWAFCNGQLLPISQNTALFSLLGTFYGGNGKSNFALPNMVNCAPMMWGQGAGLTDRFLGESSGSSSVTLLQTEMPNHTHSINAKNTPPPANAGTPDPSVVLARSSGGTAYTAASGVTMMHPNATGVSGSSFPHNNMMPYLTLNFCIALQGIYPPRG